MRPIAQPGTISRSVRRATKPSGQPSTVQSTGPQGTTGGRAAPIRKQGAGRSPVKLGPHIYLWILVAVEVALTGGLRKYFRKFHGG